MLQDQGEDEDAPEGTGTLQLRYPLSPSYATKLCTLNATEVIETVHLLPGSHVHYCQERMIGRVPGFANPTLLGQFFFWYNYSPATGTIVLCSHDLISSDASYLQTTPQNSGQYCRQHAYSSDLLPCGTNPNWNYCTPLTPGLRELLQGTVKQAVAAIIEAAKRQGYTVIVRTPPPVIPHELAEQLQLVYENGVFKEFYDSSRNYGAENEIVPVTSTWYGEIYLAGTDDYANVIGSTGDPRIAGLSWIQLWQNQFGPANQCSSLNFQGFVCGPGLYGGHVILGQVAQAMPIGSNAVFIMPICVAHNNNNNVYMGPVTNDRGIALATYLQISDLPEALRGQMLSAEQLRGGDLAMGPELLQQAGAS